MKSRVGPVTASVSCESLFPLREPTTGRRTGRSLYTSGKNPDENLSPTEIGHCPSMELESRSRWCARRPASRASRGRRCVAASGQFSPRGGKWIAFQSNESDRFEIYIQRFPKGEKECDLDRRWCAGPLGTRRKELFYIGSDDRLMRVSVDLESGEAPEGACRNRYSPRIGDMGPRHPQIRNYSVSQDGSRFLIDVLRETVSPVRVILNWKPKS